MFPFWEANAVVSCFLSESLKNSSNMTSNAENCICGIDTSTSSDRYFQMLLFSVNPLRICAKAKAKVFSPILLLLLVH